MQWKYLFLKLLLFFLIFPGLIYANNNCPDNVIQHAQRTKEALEDLPPFTDDKEELDLLVKQLDQNVLFNIKQEHEEYKKRQYSIEDRRCFLRELGNENNRSWWSTLTNRGLLDFGQQAFEKGGSFLLSLRPFGASRPLSGKAEFLSSAFIRYGRSIGGKGKLVGRKFRWTAGLGVFKEQEFIFVLTPGLNYAFKEIQVLGLPVTTPVLELHYLYGTNRPFNAIELGLSFEGIVLSFGISAIGYQDFTQRFYLTPGLQFKYSPKSKPN